MVFSPEQHTQTDTLAGGERNVDFVSCWLAFDCGENKRKVKNNRREHKYTNVPVNALFGFSYPRTKVAKAANRVKDY